jgi:hypothetical protein
MIVFVLETAELEIFGVRDVNALVKEKQSFQTNFPAWGFGVGQLTGSHWVGVE